MTITIHPDSGKGALSNIAEHFICEALDGRISPLEVKILASQIAYIADVINKNEELRTAAINEAEKYGKADRIISGQSFDVRETGTKYDYSESEAYLYVKGKEAEIVDVRKSIEETAKVVKEAAYVEVFGNHLEVKPAAKSSITNVVITLNK